MSQILKDTPSYIQENVRQWAGQRGTIYYHKITMRGSGETGEYGSQTPQCQKFQVGVEVEFEREVKVNGQYTNIIFKPAQKSGSGGGNAGKGGGGYAAKSTDMVYQMFKDRVIVAQSAMQRAIELLAFEPGVPLTEERLKQKHDIVYNMIMEKAGYQKVSDYYKSLSQPAPAATPPAQPPVQTPPPPPAAQPQTSFQDPAAPSDDLPF